MKTGRVMAGFYKGGEVSLSNVPFACFLMKQNEFDLMSSSRMFYG